MAQRGLKLSDPSSGTAGRQQSEGDGPYRTDAHAVVIGIDRYQDPAIHDLRYGRADAEAIYAILTDPDFGRFDPENVRLLLDDEATRRQIWSAIGTQLPRRAGEEDTVYIYYAGHGAPVINPGAKASDGLEKYLVPADAELDDLRATGISMEDIQKLFGWIESRQVLFFIDSCYSGVAGGRTFAQPDFQHRAALTDEFLDKLAGEGRCVVTACGINEVSLETPDLGHGLFTYYVVEGLKGAADADGDGLVTMQELYDYVYKQVTAKARSLGGSMKPVQKGFVQGRVYLTRYETESQKRARELHAEAAARYEAGSLDEAFDFWEQVLALVPDHEMAQQGLAEIESQRQEEERQRAEAERDRRRIRVRRQKELLRHYRAGDLPLPEYNRGMTLLQKSPDEVSESEKELWDLLEHFADGQLGVSVYLQSVRLIEGVTEDEEVEIPSGAPTPKQAEEDPRMSARMDAARGAAEVEPPLRESTKAARSISEEAEENDHAGALGESLIPGISLTEDELLRSRDEVINADGETALMIAARSGRLDMVESLVYMGADISKVDNRGETVRQKATRNPDPRVFEFIDSLPRKYKAAERSETDRAGATSAKRWRTSVASIMRNEVDSRERVIGALAGAAIGTAIGVTAITMVSPGEWFAGLIPGAGGGIAGAISGKHPRIILAATIGAAAACIVGISVMPDGKYWVPRAAIFFAPAGAIVGAIFGAILVKRKSQHD